jgi:hypothetical protein
MAELQALVEFVFEHASVHRIPTWRVVMGVSTGLFAHILEHEPKTCQTIKHKVS